MLSKNIAYVGSTLPFQLIATHHKTLGIDLVVCSSERLKTSYQKGFARIKLDIEVTFISGGRLFSNLKLLYHLSQTKTAIVFHECGWRNLDIYILFFGINTFYLPNVTLAGRTHVPISKIPGRKLLIHLTSRWFNYYETRVDGGGDGIYYVPAVKERYRRIDDIPASLEVPPNHKRNPSKRYKILILCSTDVVSEVSLREVYGLIIKRLVARGFEVHIKDHPNPSMRLGDLTYYGGDAVDSDLPMECLDLEEYSAFISVASTGLAFAKEYGRLFSIVNLLPKRHAADLEIRLAHLRAINTFPEKPESIEELIEQICGSNWQSRICK